MLFDKIPFLNKKEDKSSKSKELTPEEKEALIKEQKEKQKRKALEKMVEGVKSGSETMGKAMQAGFAEDQTRLPDFSSLAAPRVNPLPQQTMQAIRPEEEEHPFAKLSQLLGRR